MSSTRAAEVLGSATGGGARLPRGPGCRRARLHAGLVGVPPAHGDHDGVLVPERAAEAASLGLVPPAVPTTWWRSRDFPDAPRRHGHVRLRVVRPAGSARSGRRRSAAEVIWIDHHRSNDGLGTIPLIDPAASSTCEMVFRLIEAMGGGDAGRDRRLPVRRARDGHRPVPVRGDHARDAPHRRRAPRASVRSRAHGAGAVRGQPARSTCGSRPSRSARATRRPGRRPGVDVPDAGRPGRRRRRTERDRRSDRPDPHGPRRRRRGRAQAAAGRPVQGQHPVARGARPRGDRRRLRRRRAPAGGRIHLGARPGGHDRAAGRRVARARAPSRDRPGRAAARRQARRR